MKRFGTVMAAVSAALGLAGIAGAQSYIYKHSQDAPGDFGRYDVANNTWETLNNYPCGTQMTASATGQLYALNSNTNWIQRYDPSNDTWSDVIAGPQGFGGTHNNLEIKADGEFVITGINSQDMFYTVGGNWNSVGLGFQPNALTGYDISTDRIVVGEYGTDLFRVYDASSYNLLGQINMGGGNGEHSRGGTAMNGRFYAQYDSMNLLSFDIASIAGLTDHGGGTSYGFYDSLSGDPTTGLMYVASLDGMMLKSVDVGNGNLVTDLAGSPQFTYHSSITFVGRIPAPGAVAILGLGGLVAARRRRN
jgi:hypothetical protein